MLEESCTQQEAREARRAAHTLKSNLRNLGFNEAAALAGHIECLTQAADWEALAAKLPELRSHIHCVVDWCEELLAL